MAYLLLFLLGILAYIVSTLAAGGGALILLPMVGFYLSPAVVAPVVNLGNMIGRPVRLVLFWRHIDWKIVRYYVPSAIVGAVIGGYVFAQLQTEWMQFVLGLFLISTVFQFRFGKKKQSFPMKLSYFIPLGLLVSFISTLFGATGPILNPFYLNYGLLKERMIATKTANSFIAGMAQLSAYVFFGALHGNLWWYGLLIGAGAVIGNIIGKKILHSITETTFRKIVIALMFLSGVLMIYSAMMSMFN